MFAYENTPPPIFPNIDDGMDTCNYFGYFKSAILFNFSTGTITKYLSEAPDAFPWV